MTPTRSPWLFSTSTVASADRIEPEERQEVRQRRLDRAKGPVGDLQRDPEPVGGGGAEQSLRSALGDPPVERLDEDRVGADGATQQLGVGAHRPDHLRASLERPEPAERVGGPVERQRERRHAASVHPHRHRGRRDLGRLGDLAQHRLLARVLGPAVSRRGPAFRTTQREKPGVLARAVVLERGRGGAALELVLRRRRVGEDPAHDRELGGRGEMRGAEEHDLLVVEVRPRPHHGERLDRLRGRPEERDLVRVAGGELDAAVTNRDGVHHVPGLDHLASRHLDDDRLHGAGA